MSNVYTLIIYKDMKHELYETENGFFVNVNDDVAVVYNATSNNDAMLALRSYVAAKKQIINELREAQAGKIKL